MSGQGVPAATGDFFVCDFLAAVPKHDLASMEHPLFSLSTRPDRRILNYEHNGTTLTITPSVKGRATIFDADILIFCISQLMAALNAGKPTARTLTLTAQQLKNNNVQHDTYFTAETDTIMGDANQLSEFSGGLQLALSQAGAHARDGQ